MSNAVKGLIAKYREALNELPRVTLGHLPTPLDRCPRISAELGVSIYVKREDCTGLAMGGNKVRQHEYVLGQAVARGTDCLIQGSASQSNHSRQLAAAGARLGLDVYLTPKLDAHSKPTVGNFFVDHLLGATICPIGPEDSSIDFKRDLARRLEKEGRRPYITGMGATETLILAAVAYVDALFEIVESTAPDEMPDWIFVASQGSTQAGLILGCEMLGLKTRVVGISPMPSSHEAHLPTKEILSLVKGAASVLGFESQRTEADIITDAGFVGAGYGFLTDAARSAIHILASREGILLDPVYSGKAFAGLLDYCARGAVLPDQHVVFIHTGGTPALFAYAEQLLSTEAIPSSSEIDELKNNA